MKELINEDEYDVLNEEEVFIEPDDMVIDEINAQSGKAVHEHCPVQAQGLHENIDQQRNFFLIP